MTATLVAPASITDLALSSVMPPMATVGSPAWRASRTFSEKRLRRGHERGDRAFHVGGAAAVQITVAFGRHERIGLPLVDRAGRHHVGMAGEADEGARVAATSPQIRNAVHNQRVAPKAERP